MSQYVIWLLIFMTFISDIICSESKDDDTFIPTHEWQVVRRFQKGLHVRMNLEAGVTEAKLLNKESEELKNKAVMKIPQKDIISDEPLLDTKGLKETLKRIKGDDILKPDEIRKTNKLRSYEELKKEINSLNLIPKIGAEVLRDLLTQHKEEIKKERHDFDNGVEFVRQNGFQEVIYKNLNMSDNQIKQETLKLFGSLVQNNGKVQIHALETSGVPVLLRILNLEQSVEVKSRAIHAMSCLLRRFPLAQLRFVENGGLSVVMKILENDPMRVQIKLVTLMNDLLMEHKQALQDKHNENHDLLVSQYQLVNLEKLLLEQQWCEYLNKLLYLIAATDPEDHDSIEKCMLAMHTVADKCLSYYSKDILVSLQEKYRLLALSDLDRSDEFSNSDFFTNLYNLCRNILPQKYIRNEL
ncbi:hypothetical protein NQ317_014238 [Molorchus minor]|uniref:Nucleotide exchange factor SIL1 n=1 Tax=Molorchus minor TaxID=1323400 RepID=A0ABQ9J061_9CUCU|nr:hypothetical protein NQ317_014238 [Molorchus minor]